MLSFALALSIAVAPAADAARETAKPVVRCSTFSGAQEGWERWAPREEIAPRFSVDPRGGRGGDEALCIETGDGAAIGGWRRRVDGIRPGQAYRFTAWYRPEGVGRERRSVGARLEWLDEKGKQARPPDYALDTATENGWREVEHAAVAPEKARSVVIELSLGWAAAGKVWWDDVELAEDTSPRDRVVRAVTIYERPRGTKSAAESVERFCRQIEAAASAQPDIICLPEGITVIGNGKSCAEVSEPVPGPTTERLGALARRLNCYLVAGVYERSGRVIYNTAVLLGRKGELVGRYRKTHLPREEVEAGLTPGDEYPIFETDFGKVGLMICWDLQFPEPARALAAQGAEVILLPIWGGNEVLARARAIENHVFLLTSSYDMKTFIVDPTGTVLAEAKAGAPVAVAELHLDRKIVQPWLGDMKTRTWRERRPDIPVP